MEEDRYTNTVEDAAKYERRRAEAAGEWPDPPDRADYDEFVCMNCGASLLPHEGPACARCDPFAADYPEGLE